MAARATAEMVKGVLLSDYDSRTKPSLRPFLRAANVLTDRVSTTAAARGLTISAAELTEIEVWLAAHFYGCSDQPYAWKQNTGVMGNFQGKTGMRLDSTKYGQTALVLDHTGTLASLGDGAGRRRAGVVWLGLPPSGQTDYLDRR